MDIDKISQQFGVEFPDGWRILKVEDSRLLGGGLQLVIGFPNGYALSIVRNPYSYGHDEGLWEVGFAAWDVDTLDWELISFEHAEKVLGVCDQVEGWNTEDDVVQWTVRMSSLPHHRGLPTVV